MDLVISLLKTNHGHDIIFTMVDQFSKLVAFVPCITSFTAADIALLFFDYMIYKFGISKKNISDHDPSIIFEFWTTLNAK